MPSRADNKTTGGMPPAACYAPLRSGRRARLAAAAATARHGNRRGHARRFAALMVAAHEEAARDAAHAEVCAEAARREAAVREEARRREASSLDCARLRAIEARAIAIVERGEATTNTAAASLALDGAYPPGELKMSYVETAIRAATAALAARDHSRAARRAELYVSSWSTGGYPPEACRAPFRPQRETPREGGHRAVATPWFG